MARGGRVDGVRCRYRVTAMGREDIIDDLAARGLVHDSTDLGELRARLAAGAVTVYCGFDPTAPSLHVGNLQSLLLLRRFQDAGHRPIALAGGATGMIGDPSGRDSERLLLDDDTISQNLASIRPQLERFLDFSPGASGASLVDNRDWTAQMTVLEFLRDVGKHMPVNTMLHKDSVRSRLEREGGISFTEFSYMLLQANDYAVLHETHGCTLQVAGSDQWGNIVAGIDLIRRRTGAAVAGLTAPLITSVDGKKFGKSTGGGGLWLDAALTSPYQLFQYFMQTDDRDVGPWLSRLTLLAATEIAEIVAAHEQAPERRSGQRALAGAICSFLHGAAAASTAEQVSGVLFGGSPLESPPEVLRAIEREVPVTRLTPAELEATDSLTMFSTAFGVSKGEVRKNAAGYSRNGVAMTASGAESATLLHGQWLLLRRGKTSYHLVVSSED